MPGCRYEPDRYRLTVTQSFLQDFQRCPQRAWYQATDPQPGYNDATATGQAMHTYWECRLKGESPVRALDIARTWLATVVAEDPTFRFTKVKTLDTMQRHLSGCVTGMEAAVYPQLAPGGHVEHTMSALLCITQIGGEDWEIWLEGTPDYVDPFARVWDWKSAASEYNAWETVEWSIQPTAYTFLATNCLDLGEVTDFTYAVAVKPHGAVQTIDVVRRESDWAWLARIAAGALGMFRAQPDGGWPVVHNHYLCSPDWCPWWDSCRGAYVNSPVVRTSLRSIQTEEPDQGEAPQ